MPPTIILAILLAIGAVGFVALPLVRRKEYVGRGRLTVVDPALEDLLFAREVTIAAIKDLAFDRNTGKLSEEDYQQLDRQYRTRAVNILQELDELEQTTTGEKIDQWIEDAVQQVRRSGGQDVQGKRTKKKTTPAFASVPNSKKRIAMTAECPSCGRPYHAGDRFCSTCGERLRPLCICCGGISEHEARFCAKCGTELAAT